MMNQYFDCRGILLENIKFKYFGHISCLKVLLHLI